MADTAGDVASSGVTGRGAPDPGDAGRLGDPLSVDALSPARLAPGSVALVGGGPGALDLITVRGLALLRQADVVVVDRLGPAGLVGMLGEGVTVIEVGKTPGRPSMGQGEIDAVLVEQARAGHRVVRLKGGDPFVLGRGGEEVLACRRAGIDVQVVPGVTSAIAGPAAGDVPVTYRGTAVALHIVNAHGDLGPADLAALRDPGTTTVLMMGVSWLPRLAAQAMLNGIDPTTPVAVVQSATTDSQREVRGTLATIVEAVEREGVTNPAVITVGRTSAEGFLVPDALDDAADTERLRRSGRQALADGDDRAVSEAGADADATAAEGVGDAADAAPAGPSPVLIGCAHGTRDRAGRDVVRAIMMRVRSTMPGTVVREAYVDVQEPEVGDVVRETAGPVEVLRTRETEDAPEAVVVPLLLSTGFHVGHDIEAAIAGHRAVSAGPLGPDPRLAAVMADRLREAGLAEDDAVVMAVAGTRNRAGQAMAREMLPLLSAELGREVSIGFIAAAQPSVADAVTAARAGLPAGGRVAVANYLLAPGHFQKALADCGADIVAEPLGDHPLIAEIVADRYEAAIGG